MKKIILVLVMILALTGCSASVKPASNTETDAPTTVEAIKTESIKTTVKVTETKAETPEEYAMRAMLFRLRMLEIAVTGEEMINLAKSTWSNTIYERLDPKTNPYTLRSRNPNKFHDDFNDSLDKLFNSNNFSAKKKTVETERPKLVKELKDFRDHPEGCEHIYAALVEYHDLCDSIIELGANPSGSLKTYGEKIDSVYDNFDKVSNNLNAEIDLILDP